MEDPEQHEQPAPPEQPVKRYPSEDVIAALTQARSNDLPQEQLALYGDVLRGLVRLAKTELLVEMQHDVGKRKDKPDAA